MFSLYTLFWGIERVKAIGVEYKVSYTCIYNDTMYSIRRDLTHFSVFRYWY